MKVDHIILGTSDLDQGIDEFEQLTGLRAQFAGVHPGIGTHNALLALGDDMYFEIIAPQVPNQPLPGPFRGFEFNKTLKVAGWVVSGDLSSISNQLADKGIRHSPITSGSRTTPLGQTISWQTIFMQQRNGEIIIDPFFIAWDDGVIHPSKSNPTGLDLIDYSVAGTPDDLMGSLLSSISPTCRWAHFDRAIPGSLLSVSLDTPKGVVKFER